jgi:alginate O-acetyltransferase complex protein AlgJ
MSKKPTKKLSRVQQAHDEVGVTKIRPAAAAVFVAFFLLMLFGVFIVDHLVEWNVSDKDASLSSLRSFEGVGELSEIVGELRQQEFKPSAWVTANRRVLATIQQTEDDIEEHAPVASWLRPWSQRWLLLSGVGNEKVYPGKESWLFYRSDVDSVSGPGFLNPLQFQEKIDLTAEWEKPPHPDPLPALIDFHQQLAARGILLYVVPIPVKPEIVPEKFTSRMGTPQMIHNSSYQLFVDQLTESGVWVADVAAWMGEYKQRTQKASFLRTDTHWTPSAMQWVASRLSGELIQQFSWEANGLLPQKTEPQSITNRGDISAMLDLPPMWNPYPSETVIIQRVTSADGSAWKASAAAELLVLGDSFSNIYSLDAMGWGESGGFVEHLGYALQQPVDRIVRNDQGALATRQLLARELARGRDRLAGKKVVLYQFASRELSFGDWQIVPLELKKPAPSSFLSLAAGEQKQVHGVIREISTAPRPGSVPYRDHVISIHLVDVVTVDNQGSFSQVVVFMQSMENNVWTRAARLRAGDEINLIVSSWSDVMQVKDGLNRSELDSLDLQLEEPVWGELVEE